LRTYSNVAVDVGIGVLVKVGMGTYGDLAFYYFSTVSPSSAISSFSIDKSGFLFETEIFLFIVFCCVLDRFCFGDGFRFNV